MSDQNRRFSDFAASEYAKELESVRKNREGQGKDCFHPDGHDEKDCYHPASHNEKDCYHVAVQEPEEDERARPTVRTVTFSRVMASTIIIIFATVFLFFFTRFILPLILP